MAELSAHFVVGLGNPGESYAETRHNIGFCVLDALAEKYGAVFVVKRRLTLAVTTVKNAEGTLILGKPLTYMNLSGEAAGGFVRKENIDLSRILVVHDDADLELGQMRLRAAGGSGGHHGLASVITALGSEEFARLRLGIGRQSERDNDLTDHVLGVFRPDERKVVEKVVQQSIAAIECWRREGVEKAMNRFNIRQ